MYIREDSIVSSSHNIFAYRFTDSDGKKHDESENDEDIEPEDCCLKHLHVQCIHNDVKYTGGRYAVVHLH